MPTGGAGIRLCRRHPSLLKAGATVGAGTPAVMEPVAEHLILNLPATGRTVTGPGIPAAHAAIDAARLRHANDRRGWEDAAAAVASEFADATAAGARPHVIRPLRRLVVNLEAEARAVRT